MSHDAELARCDREIERICEEARAGIGDAHGIYQGLHDWRTEKKLIANERIFENYRILEVGRAAVDQLVRAHYLHRWPGVVTAILALLDGGRPIGVIVFAMPPREIFIRYGVSEAWELARLFIEDSTPKNTETWFVARAIRWIRKHRQTVELLVSYADPSANHTGIIYRAGNWIQDGRTDQERKTPRFDYLSTELTIDAPLLSDEATAKRYSRKSHTHGATVSRVARVSKFRFIYWLDGKHEKRRQSKLIANESLPRTESPQLPEFKQKENHDG